MSQPTWRPVESRRNPQYRVWESLLDRSGLKKHRLFLHAGRKLVPEALARWPDRFSAVLVRDPAQIAGWSLPSGIARYHLTRELFDALDISGTDFPLLVGQVPEIREADLAAPPRGLELVCALGDPNNLGALLRSAAAFSASRVILLEEAAHPFHPKCLRAAANAQFELDLRRGPSWPMLETAAGPLLALDGRGEDMSRYEWPANLRLVLGEEGQGVPATLGATRLAIPTTGAVESLNATVAASLALHAWYTRPAR